MDSSLSESDREMVHDRAAPSARQTNSVTEPPNDESLDTTYVRLPGLGEACGQRRRQRFTDSARHNLCLRRCLEFG